MHTTHRLRISVATSPEINPWPHVFMLASGMLFVMNAVYQIRIHRWAGIFYAYASWPYAIVLLLFIIGWKFRPQNLD